MVANFTYIYIYIISFLNLFYDSDSVKKKLMIQFVNKKNITRIDIQKKKHEKEKIKNICTTWL